MHINVFLFLPTVPNQDQQSLSAPFLCCLCQAGAPPSPSVLLQIKDYYPLPCYGKSWIWYGSVLVRPPYSYSPGPICLGSFIFLWALRAAVRLEMWLQSRRQTPINMVQQGGNSLAILKVPGLPPPQWSLQDMMTRKCFCQTLLSFRKSWNCWA